MKEPFKHLIFSAVLIFLPLIFFKIFVNDFGWIFLYYVIILPLTFLVITITERANKKIKYIIFYYLFIYLVVLISVYEAVKYAFDNSNFPF